MLSILTRMRKFAENAFSENVIHKTVFIEYIHLNLPIVISSLARYIFFNQQSNSTCSTPAILLKSTKLLRSWLPLYYIAADVQTNLF